MNGIDISGHQKGINLAAVPCDFVIIKATQGTSFVSPDFKRQIEQALQLNKCVGVYHYAGGGGAKREVEHFLYTVNEYIGRAILVLDWEGDQNPNFKNHAYAVEWLKHVKDITGITPFIYMSKSVCRAYKWNASFPLWVAQYKNQNPTGYQTNPWTDKKGYGPWTGAVIFQYSSKGRLSGYNDNLDLDITHLTPEEWKVYAEGGTTQVTNPGEKPIIRYGDRGEYVKAWQTFLDAHGYKCGKIDGIFGDKTLDALLHWQQDHGIEAGYIGPQTWDTI